MIHTIEVGHEHKDILVLMHGYGGSGIMFYKVLKEIRDQGKYHIYLVDILGMGGSSRPDFQKIVNNDIDLAENYLVDWLENWRIEIGIKEKFILSGHSFGGYVSCLYALKYPQNLRKL